MVREGDGTPLQYSCLENPMDGGTWWVAVHVVGKSQTRLSDFTFTFHSHALEKEMATHSSILAWRIPGTGGPSGLLSTGSHRVGHDWSDLAAAAAALQLTIFINSKVHNFCCILPQGLYNSRHSIAVPWLLWPTCMRTWTLVPVRSIVSKGWPRPK